MDLWHICLHCKQHNVHSRGSARNIGNGGGMFNIQLQVNEGGGPSPSVPYHYPVKPGENSPLVKPKNLIALTLLRKSISSVFSSVICSEIIALSILFTLSLRLSGTNNNIHVREHAQEQETFLIYILLEDEHGNET